MAKPELGSKRVCVSCAARFYDLTRQPAFCPKCSTEQPAEQPRVRRASGNVLEEKRRAKVAVVPGLDSADAEVEVSDDDVEQEVLDDASDPDDDTDAIAEVEKENGEEER